MFSSANKQSSILEIVSYTIPNLYTGQCWYVGYYAYDPAQGKMRRQRIKLNHIERISDRRKYASGLIFRLTKKLEQGWNPFIEAENSKAYHTFKDVCIKYKAYTEQLYREDNLREKTMIGYFSMLNTFISWNETRKVPITYIYQFDRVLVSDFLDYIFIQRKNSIRTRNNYLTWLSIFDSYLVQQCYINNKVTKGITSIRRISKKKNRDIIPAKDILRLKDYLEKNNKHFLLAAYLLYYTMIRPKEMSHLKLENFHLQKQTVFISGDFSKNRKSEVVTLPEKVIRLMLELKVFDYPETFYLFSYGFLPGPKRRDERQMREYWEKYIRKDLNFPDRYMFYSLKDSGITSMLRNEDALSVRDQARHSDLSITNNYTDQENATANDLLKNYEGIF